MCSLFLWWRFWRRRTYPWTNLAIALWRCVSPSEEKEWFKARLLAALLRIDAIALLKLMNELLW